MDVARARSPDQRSAIDRPRQAWLTPLYRLLEARYESVKAQWEERFESRFGFWRGCVEAIVTRFLDCGILDNGFARVRCTGCRKDMLVAFSCKGRGLCPSCAAKRAAETANRLREEVLEPVGHAQWQPARATLRPPLARPWMACSEQRVREPARLVVPAHLPRVPAVPLKCARSGQNLPFYWIGLSAGFPMWVVSSERT